MPLFPSILPGKDEPFVDDTYGKRELERKEWDELREIASTHENEDVNGHSTREEIIETLTGEERV